MGTMLKNCFVISPDRAPFDKAVNDIRAERMVIKLARLGLAFAKGTGSWNGQVENSFLAQVRHPSEWRTGGRVPGAVQLLAREFEQDAILHIDRHGQARLVKAPYWYLDGWRNDVTYLDPEEIFMGDYSDFPGVRFTVSGLIP